MVQGSHCLPAEGRSVLTCPCQRGVSRAAFLSLSASGCPGQGIQHCLKCHQRQASSNLFIPLYPWQACICSPTIHNILCLVQKELLPQGWRSEYSCSPCGTWAWLFSGTDACIPSSMPPECLPPDWLLKLLGYSWACLSRLSSHYFSSASPHLPITAQLNESYSKCLMRWLQMAGILWKAATFLSPANVSCQRAGSTSSC